MSNTQRITLGALGTVIAISVSIGSILYSAGYQGARIDGTEERVSKIESRLERIGDAVQRMEGKLNAVLEGKNKQQP